jgi:hypothetical protein
MPEKNSTPNGKGTESVSALRRYLLPFALGLFGAYTGVAFALGTWQQRIIDLEKQVVELKAADKDVRDAMEKEHDFYVPNREYDNDMKQLNDMMKQINGDITNWRQRK